MGVFKEEAHFLEDLEKKQERIWPDSCDVGINASEVDIERMRSVIKELLELPGSKLTFKTNKPAIQRQYDLIIMWGKADSRRYDATKYDVLYYKDRKREYFSITSSHVFTDSEGQQI